MSRNVCSLVSLPAISKQAGKGKKKNNGEMTEGESGNGDSGPSLMNQGSSRHVRFRRVSGTARESECRKGGVQLTREGGNNRAVIS